jgi:hypothetical protein
MIVARVEWSALSGDDVEAVLSNLLYNVYERALRVRPSQGDYGIDVLVPTDERPEKWDVYQIKKFAQNLTANQKSQIEDSFGRVLVGLVRRGVPLNDWYLVMPLDPTLDNLLDWFNDMPEKVIATLFADEKLALTDEEKSQIRAWRDAPGRIVGWKALPYCQNLAAEYGYVIDYYLHGGAERIRTAVSDVGKLLQRDLGLRDQQVTASQPKEGSAAVLEPGEVREHLQRLNNVLDTDPHFRYEVTIGPYRPDLPPEPRLVAATQENMADGGWLTFKIYERSAQSLDERPIPLHLEFHFEDSPEDREAFEVWRKYGKPLEVSASFKADLPGGLDGEGKAGRIRLGPADGETEFRNRLRIVEPSGTALAELGFAMSSTTGLDGTGVWTHGEDDSGTLATEALVDGTALGGKINFTVKPLAGRSASKSLPAANFASHLAAPNRLQVAAEYGPFLDFSPLPAGDPLVHPAVARIVHALAVVQTRTGTEITIPALSDVNSDELRSIRRAAALIDGQVIVGRWTGSLTFDKFSDAELVEGHYQVGVIERLAITIDGVTVELGSVEWAALSALVSSGPDGKVHAVPHLNDTVHTSFLPDDPADLGPHTEGKQLVRVRPLPAGAAQV